ncbi:hypothetical protein G6F17_000339 [Rhizopus arrhizus]|nr:hypothetical protein G6F20_000659 [Rhizopus arrhizus]KAG0833629.1 hypothetical protein G6F19_005594 [Rhizopus arrhizus]KAG0837316.1 hypothetical protein G6F18_004968 [Rhizopus arrhizus]KAG0861153.1 hypothetical protein G6F17_000339 [Rhizopus arrhizus]KAG0896491.1 hypothetical protein G6F34_007314 [Rhizopus arrhizus]
MGSTNFSFSEAYAFRKLVSENKLKVTKFIILTVFQIHYSDRNVVSFLIHTGFEPELRFQLYKHKITIRDDFDPLSPSIIRDPTLLNESIERKTKLARHVFLQRLGSAFRRLKAPLYNAVTNYFLQSGLIDLNFLESFDLAPFTTITTLS